MKWMNLFGLVAIVVSAVVLTVGNLGGDRSSTILNVSYDPTRELYKEINEQFVTKYQNETGKKLTIKQSHGGSSRQARSVIDGTEADVVTLALSSDVDVLRKRGFIVEGWAKRLPHDSEPYTSTIVFVVRKGNPKGIKDWPDLVQPGISVITPNPKTSGNGKLSLLAAWGSVIRRGGDEDQARNFLRQLYNNVPELGTGARDSATTFAEEKEGDVHLTWENEALRETAESKGELQIVYPPVSIRAEPSVAWVDKIVAQRRTLEYAKAYLEYLFSNGAQETIAKYGYRPINAEVLKKHADRLPNIELFPITLIAQDWEQAQTKFFAENGIFDLIYTPKTKR
jgi:sulfate/thiosulfate-binding protein